MPDTQVQYGDRAQLTASVTPASMSCGPLAGTLTFRFNGAPAGGLSVPVSLAPGGTTATVTTTVLLDRAVIPGGAGSYPLTVTFVSTTANPSM